MGIFEKCDRWWRLGRIVEVIFDGVAALDNVFKVVSACYMSVVCFGVRSRSLLRFTWLVIPSA